MRKVKIKIISYKIPNTETFPDEYKGGLVEVGVWPPIGLMRPVLDEEGGHERLEEWAVNNIALGFIEGHYSKTEIQNEMIVIKVVNNQGVVALDTFLRQKRYEYERD